jgi:hypothetical protein
VKYSAQTFTNQTAFPIQFRTVLCFCVLFIQPTLPTQSKESQTRNQTIQSSKIRWLSEKEYNFPEVELDTRANHTFYFKNVSNDSVRIDNVRTDCGCTASDWDEQAVAVGDTGKIVVQYHANRTGSFKQRLVVWIKGQRKSETLYITGVVE